jgi:hypothetical protein
MGFLDKLRRKKDETVEKVKEQTSLNLPILLMHHLLLAEGSKGTLLNGNPSMNKLYFSRVAVSLTADGGSLVFQSLRQAIALLYL